MPRPIDALLDFLRSEQQRGVREVALDEEARVVLRDWQKRSKGAAKQAKQVQQQREAAEMKALLRSSAKSGEGPRVAEPETAYVEPAAEPRAHGATAAEKIASLAAQAENWPAARSLGSLRETMVFSTGSPEAELMLVGEAPGYHEERQREPFVGPAGKKLNEILRAMGLSRPEVYISNIVKFRPATENQTTNNRKPTLDEMASCLGFIRAEVAVVKPKCIVAMGGTAAEGLLGLSGSVGSMRGSWHEFEGIPVRVTYHPAYLLHGRAGNDDKRKIWDDMLAVMERLEMPISERQRGYFR
jgi:DNA polymerase